jgi:hypothetical protein
MSAIPWDEPATLIDLDGKAPMIGTIRECAMHFAIFKPFAKAQARILLTKPVHREGQKTRTWILNPDEIEQLAARLRSENRAAAAFRPGDAPLVHSHSTWSRSAPPLLSRRTKLGRRRSEANSRV